MQWVISLDGGPRRVNHAAVAIGNKIYSFGGYSAGGRIGYADNDERIGGGNYIDVHVLDTYTYRWQRVPSQAEKELLEQPTKPRSATDPGTSPNLSHQSSSSESLSPHWRAHSFSEDSHPLGQLRQVRPPLVIDQPRGELIQPSDISGQLPHRSIAWIDVRDEANANSDTESEIDLMAMELEWDFEDAEYDTEEFDDDVDMDYDPEDDEPILVHDLLDDDIAWIAANGGGRRQQLGFGNIHFRVGRGEEALAENPHSDIPAQRYGHTVVAWNGRAYLWGGRNDKQGCSVLIHEYDPVTNKWAIVDAKAESKVPPARDGHTAVVFGDSMYVFGGFEEQMHRFSQETYSFHFPTRVWSLLRTEGEPPQYRDFHAACVLAGKMYVFGGRSDQMGMFHTNQDLYCDKLKCLDLKTNRWNEVKTRGRGPCGRRSHTMWAYEGCIYVFGGYQSVLDQHFNDLHKWDPRTGEWTELRPIGTGPSIRRRQCTVMVGSRLFLFGGTMPNTQKKACTLLEDLGDLHVLDFSPTLASLCARAMIEQGQVDRYAHLMPKVVRNELYYMATPNTISKPSNRRTTA